MARIGLVLLQVPTEVVRELANLDVVFEYVFPAGTKNDHALYDVMLRPLDMNSVLVGRVINLARTYDIPEEE